MIDTHELNVDPAVAAIQELEDPAALRETLEREKDHPRHPGGRAGVRNAIEERIGELVTQRAAEPVTTRAIRSGGSYSGDQLIQRTAPRRVLGETD